MAWNPNVPTVTNRVQDDLDAIRENFQHLDPLAERVDELQTVSETVSELAERVDELQTVSETVSELAERVDELQTVSETVSELAERVDELQTVSETVSELAERVDELQTVSETVSELAERVDELQTVSELAPYVQALLDSRIVEMGSNSNGHYVRWENGLQVCWRSRLTLPRISDLLAYATWTFPATFLDTGYSVLITQAWGSGDSVARKPTMAYTLDRTTSGCSARLTSKDSDLADGESWGVHLVAIGRWK